MATRWAIATGDWSNTATWNDGGVLGIPTTGDDVWANSFTVNVNQNITVSSLNNSALARAIATPAMTSNIAPSPYVAAASTQGVGFEAWRAFDRNYTPNSNFWNSSASTGWLSMDFGSSIVIDGYTIYGSNTQASNPRNWTLEGSNDNVSWNTVHTVTLGAGIAANGTYSIASIGNPTGYRYWRINVSLNGGSASITITELELYQRFTAAIASGGSFNFNTAGVVASVTSVSQGATNFLQVTNATGTVSLSVSSNITAVANQTTLLYSGAGNLTFTCHSVASPNGGGSCQVINKTGTGTLTYNGNSSLTGAPAGGGIRAIISTNGNVVINGNISGSPSTAVNGTNRTVDVSGGNLTINGNVSGTLVAAASLTVSNCAVFFSGTTLTFNGNTLGGDGLAIATSGTTNVTGTLVGGNSIYANGTIAINVTGDVYAGLQPAINCSAFTSSTVTLTGNIYNNLGRMAIWCPNIFISNTATTLWRMDTGGGNYKFLYSADTTPNLPSVTNVRSGTTFGPALSLTGTMVVLSAANTRKGVATDNTVGTAELTSADIISGINASSDSLAVRLKNILTDQSAGNIISQYKDS